MQNNIDVTDSNSSKTGFKLQHIIDNVKKWFFVLLRKWWLIAIIGFLGGLLGFYSAYSERPKYQSRLSFALEDGEGGMSGALNLAAEFGFNIGNSKNIFEGDNIMSLLTSRRIIERVLLSVDTVNGQSMTMATYYKKIAVDTTKKKTSSTPPTPSEIRLNSVSFPIGQARSGFSYLQDSVLMNMYKDFATGGSLKVSKPDKRLNLYEVSVTSYNERFSKVFTDKLIKEATSFYVEMKTKKSKETLEILETRVAQTKGSLNSAIGSKAILQDANVNPAFQQAQAQLQTKQVDISAYGGAYQELYKNLELARYQYLKDIPLLQIIDAADYPMMKIKRGKLKTALIFSIISVFLLLFVLTILYIVKVELIKEQKERLAING